MLLRVACVAPPVRPEGRHRHAALPVTALDPGRPALVGARRPAGSSRLRALAAVGWRLLFLFLWVASGIWTGSARAAERFAGPWDLRGLREPPLVTWGAKSNLVQEVYYAGERFRGQPTRVFAYYGQPSVVTNRLPAVLLVHGGGGKAFGAWADHWAHRGYVALAMDLAGHGPQGRLADGGPDQDDAVKFRAFTEADVRDMWTYHAVAAILRGHALLASRPEVDADRVGITGISWGGYLTCIVAGLDDRLKVAVPVYGCGFLHENSAWLQGRFTPMPEPQRQRWVECFDPSRYLPGVECPILFLNSATDFAYPLDSYRKSYRLVRGLLTVSVQPGLPHGHIWTFPEVDAFVDSALRAGRPLPKLSPLQVDVGTAVSHVAGPRPIVRARLFYTSDTGEWQKRTWRSVPAECRDGQVAVPLPPTRPLVCFLSVTDEGGLTVTTPHEELTLQTPAGR